MLVKIPKMCSTKSRMKKVDKVDDTGFDEFLSRISKTLYYGDKYYEEDHLSYPVIELAAEIYSDLKTGKSIDRLYLSEAAEMTQRVKINPCYLVLALLYIERLKDCNTKYLDNVAPSQLFLISLVLASKFYADCEYELSLSMFEKFSEWTQAEMFAAELSFLDALQWNTHVSEAEFYVKLVELETCLAQKLGSRRGWFTYTEMNTLLDVTWLTNVTHLLATVSCVCLTTYTASVLTLLASSALASHLSTSLASFFLSSLSLSQPSPVYPPGNQPTQSPSHGGSLDPEGLEEEIEALLNENRIGEMLMRYEELRTLPGNGCDETGFGCRNSFRGGFRGFDAGNGADSVLENGHVTGDSKTGHLLADGFTPGNGCDGKTGSRGLDKFDAVFNGCFGAGNLDDLVLGQECGTGDLKTGHLLADSSIGKKLVFEDGIRRNLNKAKEWNLIDWLLSENLLKYTHIPNSTSQVANLVCPNSIKASRYWNSGGVKSSEYSQLSEDFSKENSIPTETTHSNSLVVALATIYKTYLAYFNLLPININNVSFLFDANEFDWSSHDRADAGYLGIDGGYRLEKMKY